MAGKHYIALFFVTLKDLICNFLYENEKEDCSISKGGINISKCIAYFVVL